jgi:hypothetical protein
MEAREITVIARVCPLQSPRKAICDKGHLFRVLLTYTTGQFVNSCFIEKIDGVNIHVLNKIKKLNQEFSQALMTPAFLKMLQAISLYG